MSDMIFTHGGEIRCPVLDTRTMQVVFKELNRRMPNIDPAVRA